MSVVGLWASTAPAAVIIVPDEFATIQAAVNAAGAGDTVQVDPATTPTSSTSIRRATG